MKSHFSHVLTALREINIRVSSIVRLWRMFHVQTFDCSNATHSHLNDRIVLSALFPSLPSRVCGGIFIPVNRHASRMRSEDTWAKLPISDVVAMGAHKNRI
jgi:hypothetical protein